LDYLKAVVRLASEHRELGQDFSAWLADYVADSAAGATST